MFYKARIKLTLWYLLIIMVICFMFSVVIFKSFEKEIRRFRRPNPEIVEEIKDRVFFTLVIINGTIFIVSGALAYFLAGKTLKPIQEMLDSQNRFVADASHELRTPLTSLKTAFEVFLRGNKLNTKTIKLVGESISEVDKLQLLTSSLLRLSKTTKHFEKVSLKKLIIEASSKICPDAKMTLNDVIINGDPVALEELIVILLDNAVKFSPKGSPIKINLQKNGILSVVDLGSGISENDLPHIFERFYRSDKSRNTKGFGLGLSIAKKIVEEHGGTINVQSQLNKGSTFQVIFS